MVFKGRNLFACYVDESGDTATLSSPTAPIQPLLCVLGLAIDLNHLSNFTQDFLYLKTRFFPALCHPVPWLEVIMREIKGVDIRKTFRSPIASHGRLHHHIGFLDEIIRLVENYDCKIFGRVLIKPLHYSVDQWATYTSAAQGICETFNHLLITRNDFGVVTADARSHAQNSRVSFSVFTRKFKATGDSYPRITEMPMFGHSENHAGIQVCDLLASSLLFPIAAYSYCTGHVSNVHVNPGYLRLKQRYGIRLRHLQHRYQDPTTGNWYGGITVSDPFGYRHAGYLFR